MGIIIILFIIATILALTMLSFRAWQIETMRIDKPVSSQDLLPKIYFRHLEKNMLHLTKYIIQWIILVSVKYWYILLTKTTIWMKKNWPKISNFLKRKSIDINQQRNSFVRRAVYESRVKIKRIKEKVIKEHSKEKEKE